MIQMLKIARVILCVVLCLLFLAITGLYLARIGHWGLPLECLSEECYAELAIILLLSSLFIIFVPRSQKWLPWVGTLALIMIISGPINLIRFWLPVSQIWYWLGLTTAAILTGSSVSYLIRNTKQCCLNAARQY